MDLTEVLAVSLAGAMLLTDTLRTTGLAEGCGRRWIRGRAMRVKSLSVASVSPSPSGRISRRGADSPGRQLAPTDRTDCAQLGLRTDVGR